MMDANAVLSPELISTITNYISLDKKLKELTEARDKIGSVIKSSMKEINISKVRLDDGTIVTIAESQRNTVPKAVKDKFVNYLIENDKRYLVKTVLEPDIDSILSETSAGMLDKKTIDKYIQQTPVVALRYK